jgi:hypothetical protein
VDYKDGMRHSNEHNQLWVAGYDTDALGDDLTSILEIGGGSSKVPEAVPVTVSTSTVLPRWEEDQYEWAKHRT